ncbi:MAG TPA: TetR family transcriptional regulator [Myxococcota bacterium]|nr:TetR family transcriptional regulator [Myxococcota bacterium]HQK51311.1 TetR family transcriptional regulator [Myxococcota bacterium]
MKRKARRSIPVAREVGGASGTGPLDRPRRITRATRRRLEARERVIAVARDLFLERGFDETPVREIVARSGISMRTFFRYFPSKEDLAFPRADEGTQRLQNLLGQHRNPERPLVGIRDALAEFSRWYDEMREEFLKEWRYESRSTVLIARGAEIEARNQGVIADALIDVGVAAPHARYLASVIFGGIRANLEAWFEEECRRDLLEVSGNTLLLLEAMDLLWFDQGRFRVPDSLEASLAVASSVWKGFVSRVGERVLGRT